MKRMEDRRNHFTLLLCLFAQMYIYAQNPIKDNSKWGNIEQERKHRIEAPEPFVEEKVEEKIIVKDVLTTDDQRQEQNVVSEFAGIPQDAIFEIGKNSMGYIQIFGQYPDGKRDTIWFRGIVMRPKWRILSETIKDPNLTVVSNFSNRMKVTVDNAIYPRDAFKEKIEGKVEVECVVGKNGYLNNINIISHVSPTIDKEAIRILSNTVLEPCRINNRRVNCRHKLALLFDIEENSNHKKEGKVYVVDADNLSEGVSKRFKYGLTATQTTTTTGTDRWGFRTTNSYTSGQWHTSLEIDIPQNNLYLEKILCNLLFNKNGNSVEEVGKKFAKKFSGTFKTKEFKGIHGNNIEIKAHVLDYKPEKYYVYEYIISLGSNKTVSHNFIYDIQNDKILNTSDVLSEYNIENEVGAIDNTELGLNDYFLYLANIVGSDVKIPTIIGLSKDNWNKFTPLMQNMIGSEESFPQRINESDLLVTEDGVGIQPVNLVERIVKRPLLRDSGMDISDYLTQNVDIPKEIIDLNKDLSAIVSYVVEKDGTLSHIEVLQTTGDTILRKEIMRVLNTLPRCEPLTLSLYGPVRFYFRFRFKISQSEE